MRGVADLPADQVLLTPPEIFEALAVTFDLDPCSPGPGMSYVPTLRHYTAAEDGLSRAWDGLVWMHPPQWPHLKAWMAKLADHGNGIALMPAKTDVQWFQRFGVKADMICFVTARVRFFQGDITSRCSTATPDLMLLAYGPKAASAVLGSSLGPCFASAPPAVPNAGVEDLAAALFGDLHDVA